MNDKQETKLFMVVQRAEQYLQRPLAREEIRIIYAGLFKYEMHPSVVMYAVCVKNTEMGEREAYTYGKLKKWKDSGLDSVELIQKYEKTENMVRKVFSISRQLSPLEETIMVHWAKLFSFELVNLACERTMEYIQKPSFSYCNKILENWKQHNLLGIEEVIKAESEYKKERIQKKSVSKADKSFVKKNAFNNISERSYNMEELELKLLNAGKCR